MPPFFFRFCIDGAVTPDSNGVELEDSDAAKQLALISLKEELMFGENESAKRSISCSISDSGGDIFYNISLEVTDVDC